MHISARRAHDNAAYREDVFGVREEDVRVCAPGSVNPAAAGFTAGMPGGLWAIGISGPRVRCWDRLAAPAGPGRRWRPTRERAGQVWAGYFSRRHHSRLSAYQSTVDRNPSVKGMRGAYPAARRAESSRA